MVENQPALCLHISDYHEPVSHIRLDHLEFVSQADGEIPVVSAIHLQNCLGPRFAITGDNSNVIFRSVTNKSLWVQLLIVYWKVVHAWQF